MGSERSMKSEMQTSKIDILQTSDSYMNLSKSKALGYELAEDWILFWTSFMPIALILNLLSNKTILIYKGLFYIIFVFAMTLIRRNIVSSLKYLLSNLLIVLLAFIISFTFIEKVFFLVPIIICFAISIKKRKNEVVKFYTISLLLLCEFVMFICYFLAIYYNFPFMANLINFSSINIAITCILYVFISRLDMLMEWECDFVKKYSKRMRSIKLNCIGFISGIIIFFILLAWSIGLYNLMDEITSNILAWRLINNVQPQPVKQQLPPPSHTSAKHNLLDYYRFTGKSSYLMTVISNIFQLLFYVAFFLIVIYFLFKLFIFLKSLTLKKTQKNEKRESVISMKEIVSEIKEKSASFKVELELPFNMSNRKKIRKLYHKLIKSYKAKQTLAFNFNTPIEIENNVRKVLEKNISEATIIYEKARYSDAKCTNEDVDKMKSFLRN
jgi:hypothetical protein